MPYLHTHQCGPQQNRDYCSARNPNPPQDHVRPAPWTLGFPTLEGPTSWHPSGNAATEVVLGGPPGHGLVRVGWGSESVLQQ